MRGLTQVDAVLLLERVGGVVHQAPVEAVAAQVTVARRGPHIDHAIADVEEADLEGTVAQVEDEPGFVLLLVQTEGDCGRGRFVDASVTRCRVGGELSQHQRAALLRRAQLFGDLVEAAAGESLRGADGPLGVGDRLPAGEPADKGFASVG
ncbi:hypothetical protein AQJ64_03955 [Streptomyces griseoruber]|uniref:Uncharacterized protein n=1 Tax=Streptomyces griseoruber TaxID=1943 RepID=A0A101T9H0_9ACTN|nr:hypothetical protein AQJ64_03955 [Streptomyces griseoruber]